MELDLLIAEHPLIFVTVFVLAAILIYLRVTGYDPEPSGPGDTDPIAEADFHMAYGLYDKAAETIRRALAAQPVSAELSAKLLEIYFVAQNGDDFLEHARFYKKRFGRSEHWDQISQMGQELLPQEDLFR